MNGEGSPVRVMQRPQAKEHYGAPGRRPLSFFSNPLDCPTLTKTNANAIMIR